MCEQSNTTLNQKSSIMEKKVFSAESSKELQNLPQAQASSGGGFDLCRREVELGLLFLSLLYASILSLDPPATPAPEFCHNEENINCRRPDLLAYKITSGIAMMYMGLSGIRNWYFNKDVQELSSSSSRDRLFRPLPAANHQNVAILVYQIWDICVSLTIPEHRQVVFMVHHVLAGLTAFYALEHQMVAYYSIFYGGCSEVSSIFLVWADAGQFFPPAIEGSAYGTCLLVCQVLFAITFFVYRVYGWIRHSIPLWKDALSVMIPNTNSVDDIKQQQPQHEGNNDCAAKYKFLYLFLVLNVLLGSLQLFWFGKIVEKAMEMFL